MILLVVCLTGCSDVSTSSQIPKLQENKTVVVSHEKKPTIDSSYIDEYTKSGWTLTFQDEFEQSELSSLLWNKVNTGYKAHGRLHYYLPEQVTSDLGTLKLNVDNTPYKDFPYRSGAVTTQGIHEQLYGKFEIRAKFPSEQGLFPAIWLLPSNNQSYPEIDIVEMLGQLPTELWHVAHKEDGEREYKLTKDIDGSEWHVYTLDWLANELIFSIDGSEKFRTPNISNTPMYLWMNVAVGGNWVGDPNEKTVFPSSMEVDYVRIYSKE
jgi:beta-glucanase (GH16 family)